MKVGILTASRTNNIGTDLQALAMLMILSRYSNGVELVNYKCKKLENSRKIFYPRTFWGLWQIPLRLYRYFMHEKFRKKYFKYSKDIYDKHNLKTNVYDIIIVGSDQVWNLDITDGDLSFFLPECKCKKFSYAVSLGKINIDNWETKYHIANLLKNFETISLREVSAMICIENLGLACRNDLDPLLMVDSRKWLSIAKSLKINYEYVLVYAVDNLNEMIDYALLYAKKHRLKVIVLYNSVKPIFKQVNVIRYFSIQEWLSLINNANLVVTNSYHCLSFVINFHKNFKVFNLKDKQSNTRLENLLNYFEKGVISNGECFYPNWVFIEDIINKNREKSLKYIEGMFVNSDVNNK